MDGIPTVLHVPDGDTGGGVVVWMTHLGGSAEQTVPMLGAPDRVLGPGPGNAVAGGVSMGGDVAIALAGIDARVRRVATVGSTPDWNRPDMRDLRDPAKVIDQGAADPGSLRIQVHPDLDHLGVTTNESALAAAAQWLLS